MAVVATASSDANWGPVMRIWPGRPYPLGLPGMVAESTSPSSQSMRRASSCACSIRPTPNGNRTDRITEQTDLAWHLLPEAAGQLYGYRVHGPYEPEQGRGSIPIRSCGPYAKQPVGQRPGAIRCSAIASGMLEDLSFDKRDNASSAPLAVVIDTAFTRKN